MIGIFKIMGRKWTGTDEDFKISEEFDKIL